MRKLSTSITALSVKMEHPIKVMHRKWNILAHMEQQQDQQVPWRRDKIQELCSKGYSQREISQVLQVGLATVNRDISHLRMMILLLTNFAQSVIYW